MRILLQPAFGFRNTHLAQQFKRPRISLGRGHTAMHLQPFGQLAANGEHWVQGCHRFLEDHPDLIAANRAHQGLLGFGQIDLAAFFPIKNQLAARNCATAEFD